MLRMLIALLVLVAVVAQPVLVTAGAVPGTYYSAFRGGAVLNGHVSVSRQYPNSGNPKIFNGQSWNSSVLGSQWEIKCGVETTSNPPDSSLYSKTTGTGFITYNQTFEGGTFAIYYDATVGWGSGSGTINTTAATSQIYYYHFIPMSSSFTALTSGSFDDGCTLDFAMTNGFGVGETPYLTKPTTYPTFLAADCSPADAGHQYGIWADANDIIAKISCEVSTEDASWGRIKEIFR
jgi:hypothetical protein